MRDTVCRRDRFDVVGLLEGLQAVPEPDAAAEKDRDLHDMHVVDQPCGEEVAYDRRPTAEADVLATGRLAGRLERLRRGGVEEVERGATFHLDRRSGPVGEHEDRRVE